MTIREIEDADLGSVIALLTEGFPRRQDRFWRRGLENMRALPPVSGFPRFGYLIEEAEAVQGIILLLATQIEHEAPRANIACWYVREPYRTKAPILYRLASMHDRMTYTNLTPASNVIPIVKAFGFRPYTMGVCLLTPGDALRPSLGWSLPRDLTERASDIDTVAARHQAYGCRVIRIAHDNHGFETVIYRIKWLKDLLPCAQILYGTPNHVLEARGPLMRHLLGKAIPFALVDVDSATDIGDARLYAERNLRYSKGGRPNAGDMLDSELALFGP